MTGLRYWENWEAIHNALTAIEYRTYGSSDDEETYIDEMINAYRGVCNSHRGESVRTEVYKTHNYPRAEFHIPARTGTQRCEIADLCFDVEVRINGSVTNRRALISQSKMSKSGTEKWTVDLTQHYLLTFLPSFESPNLGAGPGAKRYSLANPRNALSNYSLASRQNQPTYCSAAEIGRGLSNWTYGQGTSTYSHRKNPTYLETTVGLTSALVNGYAGSDLLAMPGHEEFINDLVNYAKRKGSNPRPDGGQLFDDERGLTVIRIIIDREE